MSSSIGNDQALTMMDPKSAGGEGDEEAAAAASEALQSGVARSSKESRKGTAHAKAGDDEDEAVAPGDKVETREGSKLPPRMSAVDDSVMLPEGYEPSELDVLVSWARQNHGHPGNERFRQLIDKHAPVYLEASTKYQKSEVIAKIVTEVRTNSPDGGFVKKDFYSGRWYEIGDEKARDKVGHAIRKAAGELSKKRPGGSMSSQKVSQLAMQKRQTSSQRLDNNLDLARLGLVGAGGLNPQFLNNPSLLGLNPSTVGMGSMGLGLGDYHSDRVTASFLRPTLNQGFMPPLSSTSASSAGEGIGANNAMGTNELLLQSLQRQQLLMNAAAQAQQQSRNLQALGQQLPSGLSYLAGMNPLLLPSGLSTSLSGSLQQNPRHLGGRTEEYGSTDDED